MDSAKCQISFDQNPSSFAKKVLPLLEKEEGKNSLILGLVLGMAKKAPTEPFLLVEIKRGDNVIGAAVQSAPPYSLVLTDLNKTEVELLTMTLAQKGVDLPGVIGPRPITKYFSEIWSRLNFCQAEVALETKYFEVREVLWPPKTNGEMKVAAPEEMDLILDWLEAFHHEAVPHDNWDRDKMVTNIGNHIKQHTSFFWKAGGEPVAYAHLSRPTKNGICISAVFTPKKYRGHGYASNLVAQISQKCLEGGYKFTCLNTDASNPISNRIYQKIGYQYVAEHINYRFLK